jgi:hypothetical protein
MTRTRTQSLRRAMLPACAALGLAALLGGCVVAPAYPDYGYYAPGYAPGYVAFGGGWGWHGGWHDDGYWHR